jgi:hypothetical protein
MLEVITQNVYKTLREEFLDLLEIKRKETKRYPLKVTEDVVKNVKQKIT